MKIDKANAALTAATVASLGLYGYYIARGLRTSPPGEDQDVAGDLKVELHEFATADGMTLRVKRYANPEGTPVLLCHGFGGNGHSMDLPREGRNIAVHLAREGFDVWVSSFRGCGNGPYESECDGWHHSIDDLAIYDADALVNGVSEATGKRLFYIGHSMGGEVLYMYMQGAAYEDGHVVSDPGLVRERHEKLQGGITLGSPPAFWYPPGNPYFFAFGSKPGRAVLRLIMNEMLRREVTSPKIAKPGGSKVDFSRYPRLLMLVSRSPFVISVYARKNTDKQASTSLLKYGSADTSAGMNVQMMQGMIEDEFLEHPGHAEPGKQYSYTAGMDKISLPMFFITGTYDFVNAEAIRRFGYERVASEKKRYMNLEGYGHTDLLMGRNVTTDVFGEIVDWMRSI